ncbi:MAG: ankyrin repeat domain-containing protein [Bacteroidota bacterium]
MSQHRICTIITCIICSLPLLLSAQNLQVNKHGETWPQIKQRSKLIKKVSKKGGPYSILDSLAKLNISFSQYVDIPIERDDTVMMKYFLNHFDEEAKEYAAFTAALRNKPIALKLLFRHGVDPRMKNYEGKTLIEIARIGGSFSSSTTNLIYGSIRETEQKDLENGPMIFKSEFLPEIELIFGELNSKPLYDSSIQSNVPFKLDLTLLGHDGFTSFDMYFFVDIKNSLLKGFDPENVIWTTKFSGNSFKRSDYPRIPGNLDSNADFFEFFVEKQFLERMPIGLRKMLLESNEKKKIITLNVVTNITAESTVKTFSSNSDEKISTFNGKSFHTPFIVNPRRGGKNFDFYLSLGLLECFVSEK